LGKKSNQKYRIGFIVLVVLWFLGIIAWYLHGKNFAVLNPAGQVASKERHLVIITVLLGLLVIIPVYIMTFAIAWRYREGNKKAKYSPELAGNIYAETLWWGIPTAIILVLSVIAWQSSHALDPFKPLSTPGKQPMIIEVVALDWKWLFIYPDQGVASVNYIQFPVGTPVDFYITADAPMNSLWIPQLGSQIYAMPGMSTQLHLVADKAGDYYGSSANISGAGFAGMHFTASATSQTAYNNWLQIAKSSPSQLNANTYHRLAKPSQNNPTALYSAVDNNLFENILLKYMVPGKGI
jgi:cytochrome o ubiquinol oxidase subunit 2